MTKNKFEIKDKVRFIGDKESDFGEVVGLSFDGDYWSYKISSKEVDYEKKEVVLGFKFCKEEELIEVKENKNE